MYDPFCGCLILILNDKLLDLVARCTVLLVLLCERCFVGLTDASLAEAEFIFLGKGVAWYVF